MAKLSTDVIVAAAAETIAAQGHASFSMRSLATHLGVTPMALYHHYADKDALLVAVVQKVSSELATPELPDAPRERAVAVALSLLDFLTDHPWVTPLVAGGRVTSQQGLWVPEHLLRAGIDAGLDDADAFVVYRAVLALVIGQATVDATRWRPAGRGTLTSTPTDTLPHVSRLASTWPELDARATSRAVVSRTVRALLPGD